MSRILVVEDEQHLAEGLRYNLESEGYEVAVAESGEVALEMLAKEPPAFDVVGLDVMLPGKDGFTVMAEMRRAGQFVPTLMLTARGHADDILRGFDAGADDYLPKPFELKILIARIQGLLRRREWLRSAPPSPPGSNGLKNVYEFAGRKVNFELLELQAAGQAVPLTLMEANVLRYLIEHEGTPGSRKSMLENVWGLHEDTDTRAIDNFIVRLRKLIEDDPAHPKHLLTVRGVGYKFLALPAPAR